MEIEKHLDTLITDSLIRCEKCRLIVSGEELKRCGGKCPHCNTQLAKPEPYSRDSGEPDL
jgi:uncharacterized paraquat-inducible protein A